MDHTRDNPLKRFTAFWIALLLVTAFGIACIILRPLTHGKVDSAYEAAREERLVVKSGIDRAQSGAINNDALSKAIESQAKTFKEKPSAGSMAVPGAAPAPKAEGEPQPETAPEPAPAG